MLRLEGFMEIQRLHHEGLSVSEIARQLNLDRKTVRRYLKEPPHEYRRKPAVRKVDPWRAYLRERWEQGVHNAGRLFLEIQRRGYPGGVTQVREAVHCWRSEGRERAFVRFETAPGEQAQMDWGHFGNWNGGRLYGFALTLGWSRMRYVEFTQRQDVETLLNCMVHALRYFGGVPRTVLTDNMKTVVVDRVDGVPSFNPRMLDFAAYYGFVPRVCHPYRPQTKGKIESTIRYIKSGFWPGLRFDSLAALNQQARAWCEEANRRVHATTRAIPLERLAHEGLIPLGGQPDYDTSYRTPRKVAKDCLISYRGNRYSVPQVYAGRSVVARESLDSGAIRIFHQQDLLAEHKLATGKGEMVINHEHYRGLPCKAPIMKRIAPESTAELAPGPGVGLHHAIPVVALRPLSVYEEVAHVAAV